MANTHSCPYFVVGGTLTGTAASYVERRADTELLTALQAGEYCYILDTRQVGKSSLIVRAARQLSAMGRLATFLDLSTFGDAPTEEQWYGKLLADLVRALDLEDEADDFWEANTGYSGAQRWFLAMRDLVLPQLSAPLIVFVDEIEAVRKLPFTSDGFFAMIRALYNLRATEPASGRLTFCLAGVATPADLIRDPRTTPFNIGRRIALRDFTPAEMRSLANGLCGAPAQQEEQIRHIGFWTSGHPYLTQRFCQAVAEQGRPLTNQELDALCGNVFLHKQAQTEETNLHFVRRQLLDDSEPTDLLTRYYQLLSGKRVEVGSVDTLSDRLVLSGVAVIDHEEATPCLRVRNRIYARVFDRRWVRANLPDAEQRRQKRALWSGFLRASVVWAVLFTSLLFAFMRQYEISRMGSTLKTIKTDLKKSQVELDKARKQIGDAEGQGLRLKVDNERLKSDNEQKEATRRELYADLSLLKRDNREQQKDLGKTRAEKGKAEHDRDIQHDTSLALEKTGESGNELEALGYALDAVALTSKYPGSLRSEAIEGLSRAATAGAYRLFKLPAKFQLETAAFSAGGEWVVTAGRNRDVSIWDTKTGELLAHPAVLPQDVREPIVWAAEFSPDRRYLVTVGNDQKARGWDTATLLAPNPRCVWTADCGTEPVHKATACFSTSGRYLAISGRSKGSYYATVWKLPAQTQDGTLTQVAMLKHSGEISSLDFNDKSAETEERYLAVAGGSSPPVHIFDFLSGAVVYPYPPQPGGRTAVVASDTEQLLFAYWNDGLYSAGRAGPIQSWGWKGAGGPHPAAEGVFNTYPGHPGGVSCLAASRDGVLMASAGSKDLSVRIWYREYSIQPLYTLSSHESAVTSLRFSPDCHHLVTTSHDGRAEIWLFPTPYYTGSANGLNSLSVSPDGGTMAASSDVRSGPSMVLIWKTREDPNGYNGFARWPVGILGQTTQDRFPGKVLHTAFSPDGKMLATGGEHGNIRIWNETELGNPHRHFFELPTHSDETVNCVVFSPDGRTLLCASDDSWASLRNVQSGELIQRFPHPDRVLSCAFSPDGKQVLTGCRDGAARLFDLTGRLLCTLQPPGSRGSAAQTYPHSVAFSPNGTQLLTGDADGNAYVWDCRLRTCLVTLNFQHGQVLSAQFSRDGHQVIVVGEGGIAKIWNLKAALDTRRKNENPVPWPTIQSSFESLYGGQFSRDGRTDGTYVFLAGADGLVRRYPVTIEVLAREAEKIRQQGNKASPKTK